MTPEQLREYAAEKERSRARLTERYVGPDAVPEAPAAPRPEPAQAWERDVEFEGETYRVDMRRAKSRAFVRIMARVQRSRDREGSASLEDMLDLFDQLFGGEVDDHVCRVVEARLGYDDAEEIIRIEAALLEAIDAKN